MFRRVFLALFVLLVVAPVALLVAAMESEPVVSRYRASTAADAARARAVFRELRSLTEASGQRSIRVSQDDMNSILAFAGRGLPFFRGEADVTPGGLSLAFAADATRIPGGGWLNLRVGVEPSQTGLRLASVELGPFALPAGMVLPAAGLALDLVFGDDLGQIATGSIDGVAIAGEAVVLGVGLTAQGREALTRGAKQAVRSAAGFASPEDVRVYYLALDAAVRDGRLKRTGSTVPYLRFAMDEAHRRGLRADATGEIKSALFALAIYCGHARFQGLIGDVVPAQLGGARTGCAGTTLAGRRDLRQHFVISAGLEAASDALIAFTIGEFKELLDSNRGGSGFSFDDLAADRAGIRFANAFLDADAARRQRMLEVMVGEDAVLPPLHGLPTGLSESEFRRRFGDVDSAAYRASLAEIDGRIDSASIHALAR